MATLTLPPDYFKAAADRYRSNPTNRKQWLQDQIEKAGDSLLEYKKEIEVLSGELVKLGAAKAAASELQIVGGVLAAIPTGYTQVIGGVVIVASSFIKKVENKNNDKRIANLVTVWNARHSEAVAVGEYYTRYVNELRWLTVMPYALTAAFIYLIMK